MSEEGTAHDQGTGQVDTANQGTGEGQQQNGGNAGHQDGQTPDFRGTLPEEIRDHEALKEIVDASTLAQKYLELVQAKPAVPENPDAYELPINPETPINPDAVKGFREVAHKANLTQEQVQALGSFWNEYVTKQAHGEIAMVEKAEKVLRSDWGDDYEGNLGISKKALAKFGNPELVTFLEKTGLGNNPDMVRLFHKVGTAISEDSIAPAVKYGSGTVQRSLGGEPTLSFPSMEQK